MPIELKIMNILLDILIPLSGVVIFYFIIFLWLFCGAKEDDNNEEWKKIKSKHNLY